MSAAFDKEQNDVTQQAFATIETPQAPASDATASAPPAKWMDQNPQLDANGNLKPEFKPKPKWSPGAE